MNDESAPIHDLQQWIADLRRQHPRLLLLLGEKQHDSRQKEKIVRLLLSNADVGFFEKKSEKPGRWLLKEDALAMLAEMRNDPGIDQSQLEAAEELSLPKRAVLMDETPERVEKLNIALRAFLRLARDGVPEEDPVSQHVSEIAADRLRDRLEKSNPHMAEVIETHLRDHFANEKFFAVASAGDSHVRSGNGIAGLQELLAAKAFDIVAVTLDAKRDTRKKNGTYAIAGSGNNFTIEITDLDPPRPMNQRML